jgi:hypothetical protein
VSGCTKSSIQTQAPVQQSGNELDMSDLIQGGEIDPDKLAALQGEEETVAKVELVEDEPYEEEPMFDPDQVNEEANDLFGDTDFYPEAVKMDYVLDEEAFSIDLSWVLKNGTTEDVAMEYATILVQKFNDILAVQLADVEFSSIESFGGIWEQFALNVKVGTEDGNWLIDKSYEAGAKIDLKLPEKSGDGPATEVKETEPRLSPGKN